MGRSVLGAISRFFSVYGVLLVLAALCVFFAWSTRERVSPTGRDGGENVADEVVSLRPRPAKVALVVPPDADGQAFADAARTGLARAGVETIVVQGDPPTVRAALEQAAAEGPAATVVATTPACLDWSLWDALRASNPAYGALRVVAPSGGVRSTFLSPSNLRNVADQIAVIAIIAVGMTLVIITAGIDLSVGSLIALSAVLTAWLIRAWGGSGASNWALLGASICAIVLCGAVGAFSGLTITRFGIPPFIATLAMMQVASGLAFIVAGGQSIYDIPDRFTWLGRGDGLAGIPNAVVLMILIYVAAHIVMTRTAAGRHVYAVGGSPEAARLSGVSTARTLMLAYVTCGLMAGIGGVITVSQLKAGAPTYGLMYELYVIAAVVVGGTSLSGGEGRIFGTLIGAFIIAVIRNGMNLMNVEPYTQKVVLGLVILAAVLLDMLKRRQWRWPLRSTTSA